MRKGEITKVGEPIINSIQNQLVAYEPQTASQTNLHAMAVEHFFKFLELRARRNYNATVGIPGIMWYVVLLGAILIIVMIWLFDMRLLAHLLLSGLISFYIAAMIALVVALDKPLRGNAGIGPEAFQLLVEFMNRTMASPAG